MRDFAGHGPWLGLMAKDRAGENVIRLSDQNSGVVDPPSKGMNPSPRRKPGVQEVYLYRYRLRSASDHFRRTDENLRPHQAASKGH